MPPPIEALRDHLAPIEDLKAAAAVLRWDQETYMPDGGAEARAQQLSTLQSTAHERFVAEETGTLLDRAADAVGDAAPLDTDAALVRVTRRDYERAMRVPSSLVAELSKAKSEAQQAWRQARQNDDFSRFAPHLETLVELSSRTTPCSPSTSRGAPRRRSRRCSTPCATTSSRWSTPSATPRRSTLRSCTAPIRSPTSGPSGAR
jgi:Zn-dependent M32 family carboxypeptidase